MDKNDKQDKKLKLAPETIKNLTVKTSIRAGTYTRQLLCTSAPIRYTHCNIM